MTGRATRLAMLTVVALALVGVPLADAQSATGGGFVFTGSGTLNDPLWAPISPACTGFCPAPENTGYQFDSDNGGQFGQFCAGAVIVDGRPVVVGVRGANGDVVETCHVASSGEITGVPSDDPTWGPWCGLNSGRGSLNASAGAWFSPGMEVVWPVAAGNIVKFLVTNQGQVVGAGAVMLTGHIPGTCGLFPPAFLPTTAVTVTGYFAFGPVT